MVASFLVWIVLPETPKDIIADTPPAASVAVTAGGVCHYVRILQRGVRKQKYFRTLITLLYILCRYKYGGNRGSIIGT
jgi:hypothetical protein